MRSGSPRTSLGRRGRPPPAKRALAGRPGPRAAGARPAAPGAEARAHDHAGEASLPHREGEIAVVAVEKAVAFVEAADFVQERSAEAEADAVHRRHVDHGRRHARTALEAVGDGAPDGAPVAPDPPRAP